MSTEVLNPEAVVTPYEWGGVMKFKEDIFPEHKDKIGGLVQFVNLFF